MDPDHYIVGLYLTDHDGNFIAKTQLDPSEDTEASYTFRISPSVTQVKHWTLCDDHDLWMGETTATR